MGLFGKIGGQVAGRLRKTVPLGRVAAQILNRPKMPGGSRLIQRSEASQKLIKEFGTKGSPLSHVATNVQPVALVSDLSSGSEQDFNVTRWARGRGSSPAATQFGKLSFNNPAGSGVLVKVYQVDIFHSAVAAVGGIIGVTVETASAGGTQIQFTKDFLDQRLAKGNSARLPVVDIRFDNSGGLSGHWARPFVPVTGWHGNFQGLILTPGTRLHFEALDIGVEYNAQVEWTETNIE